MTNIYECILVLLMFLPKFIVCNTQPHQVTLPIKNREC